MESRQLEMGHARALLGVTDPGLQSAAARDVASKGLSVRETEKLVRKLNAGPKTPARPREKDADTRRLENELGDKLGARVSVSHSASGKGRVVIAYNSLDELEGILEHIR